MKKQSRSSKPNARKVPKAPAAASRATAIKSSTAQPATSSPVHTANDIGPVLSRLLVLPQSPPRHPKHPTATAHATTARLPDDASAFLLLSLPILAMILGLGLMQSLKPARRTELAAVPAPAIFTAPAATEPVARVSPLKPLSPQATLSRPATSLAPVPPSAIDAKPPAGVPATNPASPLLAPRTAMLGKPAPATELSTSIITPTPVAPSPVLPELASREPTLTTAEPAICPAPAAMLTRGRPPLPYDPAIANLTPTAFGDALAQAAQTQTKDFVIYNDKYRAISYPNGDVHPLYGVCTDVVIRAYRALGIDLQQQVHQARIGSGDISIDHRRTEVLRRFFARFGQQLPITPYAEDYLPGDIVTYSRPQNRHSRSHIAMVSNTVGVSGRYMIVHNRGWGPQLEDALFVDEITGHYRYRAAPAPPASAVVSTLATPAMAAPAPQKRPPAVARVIARDARVAAVRRRDGASVPGLGR